MKNIHNYHLVVTFPVRHAASVFLWTNLMAKTNLCTDKCFHAVA